MKNNNKGFWSDMFSGTNGGVSSKRVLGSIIIMVLLVVIVINTFYGTENHWLGEAFITMLVGAFALLGIGIFEKKHDINNNHSEENEYDKKDLLEE